MGQTKINFTTSLPHADYAVTITFCDNYPKFATIQNEDADGFEVWTFDRQHPAVAEDLEWTFSVISD